MSFFSLGAWAAVYAYTPESYPTALRATGMGWASAMTRIAAALVTLLGATVIARSRGLALAMFGAALVAGAVIVAALGEETRGGPWPTPCVPNRPRTVALGEAPKEPALVEAKVAVLVGTDPLDVSTTATAGSQQPSAQGQLDELGDVERSAAGALGNLLTAREAVGDDQRVARRRTDGGSSTRSPAAIDTA